MEWDNEYSESVREFLASATWISALERPLAVQLKALAHTLDTMMREDGAVQSAAASQFAGTWQRLAKRDPSGAGGGGDPTIPGLEPIPGLDAGLMHGPGCGCPACQ